MLEQHTVTQEQKLAALHAHLVSILAQHENGGSWNVVKHVTGGMMGLESRYDFSAVFGKPVRWCRVVPVDQGPPVAATETMDVGNATIIVGHEYEVLIQYQWEETNAYSGSTQEQFNLMLWQDSQSAPGVLFDLTTRGALVLAGTDEIIELQAPEAIAIPSFPVSVFGGLEQDDDSVLVHHADFRITLT